MASGRNRYLERSPKEPGVGSVDPTFLEYIFPLVLGGELDPESSNILVILGFRKPEPRTQKPLVFGHASEMRESLVIDHELAWLYGDSSLMPEEITCAYPLSCRPIEPCSVTQNDRPGG